MSSGPGCLPVVVFIVVLSVHYGLGCWSEVGHFRRSPVWLLGGLFLQCLVLLWSLVFVPSVPIRLPFLLCWVLFPCFRSMRFLIYPVWGFLLVYEFPCHISCAWHLCDGLL